MIDGDSGADARTAVLNLASDSYLGGGREELFANNLMFCSVLGK